MIAGTGIDLTEVDRIAEKLSKENGFREKIFSANEILFCETKKEKAQHYAARFAAKEAFLKASGLGLTAGFELSEIEVTNNSIGKPEIILTGNFHKHAVQYSWNKIHVSLTHIHTLACAVVIIER